MRQEATDQTGNKFSTGRQTAEKQQIQWNLGPNIQSYGLEVEQKQKPLPS